MREHGHKLTQGACDAWQERPGSAGAGARGRDLSQVLLVLMHWMWVCGCVVCGCVCTDKHTQTHRSGWAAGVPRAQARSAQWCVYVFVFGRVCVFLHACIHTHTHTHTHTQGTSKERGVGTSKERPALSAPKKSVGKVAAPAKKSVGKVPLASGSSKANAAGGTPDLAAGTKEAGGCMPPPPAKTGGGAVFGEGGENEGGSSKTGFGFKAKVSGPKVPVRPLN